MQIYVCASSFVPAKFTVTILHALKTPLNFILGTVISINLVQLAKADAPISSKEFGRTISLISTSPSNALSPIYFKLLGRIREDIAEQPEKAPLLQKCSIFC